jgi:hypothetical protein
MKADKERSLKAAVGTIQKGLECLHDTHANQQWRFGLHSSYRIANFTQNIVFKDFIVGHVGDHKP